MIICTTLDTLDNVNKVLVGNENKSPSSTASGANYLGEMAIGIFNMLLKGICLHDVLWSKESNISAQVLHSVLPVTGHKFKGEACL